MNQKKMNKKQYHEDDTVLEVEVLEDLSDEKQERFRLRVVKVIKPHSLVKDPEPGTEFVCEKLRGVYAPGLWKLRPLTDG